jgi:hypothetical protein
MLYSRLKERKSVIIEIEIHSQQKDHHLKQLIFVWTVDQICTRVENPGEGVPAVFAKIRWGRGVKALRKNCLGGPTILGFIAFLLTSVLKFAWGVLYLPSPHLTPPPLVHRCCWCLTLGHIKSTKEKSQRKVQISPFTKWWYFLNLVNISRLLRPPYLKLKKKT